MNDLAFGPLFTAERTNFGTAVNLTRGEGWKWAAVVKCVPRKSWRVWS